MTLEREAAVPTCTRPGDDHNRPQNDEMLAGEETSTAAAPAKARVQSDGKAEISAATSAVQTASVLAAGARVMSLLPQIGSWAIGLSCFAYLSGQREVSSYLGMLGAPWAMALLSPTQLMQVGAVPATTVVTFGFIAFKSLLGGTSERRLQRWLLVLLASGVLLMLASFLCPNPTWKLRLAEGSTTLILVSAGVAVGELVASLRQTGEWGFR